MSCGEEVVMMVLAVSMMLCQTCCPKCDLMKWIMYFRTTAYNAQAEVSRTEVDCRAETLRKLRGGTGRLRSRTMQV